MVHLTRERHVSVCGLPLGVRHICAFFDSRDEKYEILTPFFLEGLAEGEEIVSIVESANFDEHHRRMREGGVPVDEAMARSQLKTLAAEDTYLENGEFVADRMLDMLEQTLADAVAGPFGPVRACGDMEWALRNLPGSEDLMAYEARLNQLVPKHACTLICCYDINRFSGRAVADLMATHSHSIINGQLFENPLYVEPGLYLEKLALRRSVPRPVAPARSRRIRR